MVETQREADKEALHSGVTMRREGNEWNGRSEQNKENRSEIRTLNIKHVSSSIEVTETTSIKEGNSERVESNNIVKRMHFDSSNKLRWGGIKFSLGEWGFPIQLDVDEENKRIVKSLPDIDKPSVDVKKLEEGSNQSSTTIIGGYSAAVYQTFSVGDKSIVYREKTVLNVIGNPLVVNIEKSYDRGEQHVFRSWSAEIAYQSEASKTKLSFSTSVESEEAAMREFLSQKAADRWKSEMELKAMNLG